MERLPHSEYLMWHEWLDQQVEYLTGKGRPSSTDRNGPKPSKEQVTKWSKSLWLGRLGLRDRAKEIM